MSQNPITIETRKVFLVKGPINRTFLTMKGAIGQAIRNRVMERCDCTKGHTWDGVYEEGETCWHHEPTNYPTIVRRMRRIYKKALEKTKL